MAEEIDEELGPIEWVVLEFPPGSTCFDAGTAAELSMLVECELIRIIDMVVIDKAVNGGFAVVEFEELGDTSELRILEDRLMEVLALEDVENVVRAMTPGSTAGVLVWENTWAAPFGVAARHSGGRLLDGGPIPAGALISGVAADDRADSTMPRRPGRASRRGVIARSVARSAGPVGTSADLDRGVRQRRTGAAAGGKSAEIVEPDPCHRELKDVHVHGR